MAGTMDFSGAVQWWDEWQLRILVLGSLFVQCTLFVSAAVRRCALPPLLRLVIWLAYLGGDALAIYALATLFNRNKQGQQHDGSGLEVLWASVLLIHLGGQHMMSAYSIEDNELWRRHAITVVSQVTVAIYVFYKSWSGEKRLLQAAILLFVVGIIRSSQKTWCLMKGSVRRMVDSIPMSTRRKQDFFHRVMTCDYSFCGRETRNRARQEGDKEKDMTLEEFVQEATTNLPDIAHDQEQAKRLAESPVEGKNIFYLLVDISVPYARRIKGLQLLMALDYQHAYSLSTDTLRMAFMVLYTKILTLPAGGGSGWLFHFGLPFLTLVSVILFSTNHKNHDYNATDVKITYILLSCTAVLDFLLSLIGLCLIAIAPDKVSQSNLLSFCARKRHPTLMMKLATLVCCKDYVNMHCYIEHTPTSAPHQVAELVHGYVRDGWKGYIHDVASYNSFNGRRGQWALRHRRDLRWSLDMSFDRSVLLWHIATDLCFHNQSTTPRGQECAARSRVISNYMAYLLSIRPEMLMPGTRNQIFTVACDDVELMLGSGGDLPLDERGIAQEILVQMQPWVDGANTIGVPPPNPLKLAKALMELRDEVRRWEVIQGVWVEMLCYSAGRCRGFMHAKNMNEGLELLSRVWYLLSFMGMETFVDRLQKLEPPGTLEEEDEEGCDDGEGRATESRIYIPIRAPTPTRVLI